VKINKQYKKNFGLETNFSFFLFWPFNRGIDQYRPNGGRYKKFVYTFEFVNLLSNKNTGLFEMFVGVLTTFQLGTNSIIALMFVESQRVHILSTCKVCNENLECCNIKLKKIHILLSQVYCV